MKQVPISISGLTAGQFSALLSAIPTVDPTRPLSIGLDKNATTDDYKVWGASDATVTTSTGCKFVGQIAAARPSVLLPSFPYYLLECITAGAGVTAILSGDDAPSVAQVTITLPAAGNRSAVGSLVGFQDASILLGLDAACTSADTFDVFGTFDLTVASGAGAPAGGAKKIGELLGGGNPARSFMIVQGYPGIILVRTSSTAGGTSAFAYGRATSGTINPTLDTLVVSNTGTGQTIGALTAAQSVDKYANFTITNLTAKAVLTLPNPTDTTSGKIAFVSADGTIPFTMYGSTLDPSATGKFTVFLWRAGLGWASLDDSLQLVGPTTTGAFNSVIRQFLATSAQRVVVQVHNRDSVSGSAQLQLGSDGTRTCRFSLLTDPAFSDAHILQLVDDSSNQVRMWVDAVGRIALGAATGAGIATPDVSAALDVQIGGTFLGFLPPRMITGSRNSIVTPATGLQIFNTTQGYLEVNVGSTTVPQWLPMLAPTQVRGVAFANVASLAAFVVVQDGVTYVQGDRVLLANQTTAAECGVYVVGVVAGTAPLTRAGDMPTAQVMRNGMVIEVSEGTLYRGSSWKAMASGSVVVGTTDPNFIPRVCKARVTLSAAGTYTLGVAEGLFLLSATTTQVSVCRVVGAGADLATTVQYSAPTRIIGKSGTASLLVQAEEAAGTANTNDTSTLDVVATNW